MISLFQKELELCKVHEGETIAVLSQGESLRHYAKALVTAAGNLGAEVVEVNLPGKGDGLKDYGHNDLAQHPDAMDKLRRADMIIDLLVASFSKEGDELQQAGARMLLVCEELDTLQRLFPTEDHRIRTEASMKRLSAAKSFRFTNLAGTDVTYNFTPGRYKPLMEYGYVAEPGRWDHFPAGLIANFTPEVNGRVVMSEGDIVYPTSIFLSERIEFEIENGQVRRIKGGKQADEMRRWMDTYNDPRAYAVSHVGWGTHTAAEWAIKGIGMDGRSYYGNILFSLGPNLEFGGDNDTACHMDLPMRNCSAWLDGEQIILNGRILPDDIRAHGF
jgi:2,5-dihydroxypyridine 5,6-dioxygenase